MNAFIRSNGMDGSIRTAAALGAVSGLRTMMGPACVARELAGRDAPRWRLGRRDGDPLRDWIGRDDVASALTVMAAGELLVDKLPGLPDRVSPAPLMGRCVIGALVGAVAAGSRRRAVGALAGAAGAVAGAVGGWFVRREIARATLLPDPAVAIAEDTLAVALGRELAAQL